ncbi:MAG TPA: CheR family methyltransferase [Polyangiaceae bacterium]
MNFEITTALFTQFADIAYRRAGIRLSPGKEALVGSRVAKRIRALGLANPDEYLEYLVADGDGEELVHFLDVISTNFTSFFREPEHFDLLSHLVEHRLREGRTRLRFWSAASSSGEEPYSMAITIAEAVKQASVNWRILATDISSRVLARAQTGSYPASSLASVSQPLRNRYFDLVDPHDTSEKSYQIIPSIGASVVFRRLNLSAPPFPMRGPMDAVFCRNVMIYFDRRVRQGLISNIEHLLAPDGLFVIGHSETLNGLDTGFRPLRPSVYVLSSCSHHQLGSSSAPREEP